MKERLEEINNKLEFINRSLTSVTLATMTAEQKKYFADSMRHIGTTAELGRISERFARAGLLTAEELDTIFIKLENQLDSFLKEIEPYIGAYSK